MLTGKINEQQTTLSASTRHRLDLTVGEQQLFFVVVAVPGCVCFLCVFFVCVFGGGRGFFFFFLSVKQTHHKKNKRRRKKKNNKHSKKKDNKHSKKKDNKHLTKKRALVVLVLYGSQTNYLDI